MYQLKRFHLTLVLRSVVLFLRVCYQINKKVALAFALLLQRSNRKNKLKNAIPVKCLVYLLVENFAFPSKTVNNLQDVVSSIIYTVL